MISLKREKVIIIILKDIFIEKQILDKKLISKADYNIMQIKD